MGYHNIKHPKQCDAACASTAYCFDSSWAKGKSPERQNEKVHISKTELYPSNWFFRRKVHTLLLNIYEDDLTLSGRSHLHVEFWQELRLRDLVRLDPDVFIAETYYGHLLQTWKGVHTAPWHDVICVPQNHHWKQCLHLPYQRAIWAIKKYYEMMRPKPWWGCCGSAGWAVQIYPLLYADWHPTYLDGASGMIVHFTGLCHISILSHIVVVEVSPMVICQSSMHI